MNKQERAIYKKMREAKELLRQIATDCEDLIDPVRIEAESVYNQMITLQDDFEDNYNGDAELEDTRMEANFDDVGDQMPDLTGFDLEPDELE